ncbi:hypothetical protein BJ138DRAFT_1111709 [Hygrophoropsis aurantiaca]|uniref:Uncharacterized protein n=1 Tax=Hygrophoropsis aurantiaca TaxID=72124 RepID=A0ACB8AIX5_9AGAM|nr:hypothetical protein BJ138DRAFT_1111709 [Hygrophoropsis aurantiaca]
MSETIHYYFIQNYGDPTAFEIIPLSWLIENAATALVTCIAQVFFATRIYLVTRQYAIFSPFDKIIPAIIVFTAMGGLVCACVETYYIAILPTTSLSGIDMQITFSMAESFAIISDILATVSLCYILASARGSIRRSKSALRSLFFFILNRGILVTIIQIATMVAYLGKRGYLYWMPFQICKSKLYTNTLLAMLNSRGRGKSWSDTHTLHLRPSLAATAAFEAAVNSGFRRAQDHDPELGVEKNEQNHQPTIILTEHTQDSEPSISDGATASYV